MVSHQYGISCDFLAFEEFYWKNLVPEKVLEPVSVKFGVGKKVSEPVSEKFGTGKSIGIGIV